LKSHVMLSLTLQKFAKSTLMLSLVEILKINSFDDYNGIGADQVLCKSVVSKFINKDKHSYSQNVVTEACRSSHHGTRRNVQLGTFNRETCSWKKQEGEGPMSKQSMVTRLFCKRNAVWRKY
jgi:hypothetical protein